MIRWWTFAIAVLLFIGGLLAGRAWFPRIQTIQVDREVLRVVEKLLPGETRTITKTVPGPERRVDVPVIVERVGPDRVRTVTETIPVPVEVIRERWPQSITVTLGSVLTQEYGWATPAHPNLLIGQVSPGVYAAPKQPGWDVSQVTTETKVTDKLAPSRWVIEIHPIVRVGQVGSHAFAGAGLELQVSKDHLFTRVAIGKATIGTWVDLTAGWRF